MTKVNGIGDRFYIGGYDLSGDVSAVDTIKGGPKPLDVTVISDVAYERLGGLFDGTMDFSGFFNQATGQQHTALSTLFSSTADTTCSYARGTAVGSPSACMRARQVSYDWSRAQDGLLTFKVSCLSDGYGLEWCQQLTAGKITDALADTTYATIDFGITGFAAVNIQSTSNANPSVITTAAPYGLVVGDSVHIAGAADGVLNGDWTVLAPSFGASTFTIGVAGTGGGAFGTTVKTSTNYGLSGYLQVFAMTGVGGNTVSCTLQDSADGVTYVDITNGAFANVSYASPIHSTQRIQTIATRIVRRYVKLHVVQTSTDATIFVAFNRYTVIPSIH